GRGPGVGPRLTDTLDSERVQRRRRLKVHDGELGNLRGGGHEEVHEASGEQLAVLVVRELLVERAPDALGDAAVDLPLDDGRVHDRAAVVLDDVLLEGDLAGLDVHLDDRRVAAARERGLWRRVVAARLEPRLLAVAEDGDL